MSPWLLAVPVALLAALAVGGAKASSGPTSNGGGDGGTAPSDLPPPSTSSGLEFVRQLAIFTGAPKPWQDFFVLVAQRESKGNPNVGRGTALGAPPWVEINKSSWEKSAATTAWSRNKHVFNKCWPKAGYVFGSGGLYAMLPAYGLEAFANTELVCLHPWVVFDPLISTIMAIDFAQRLTGWKTWDGTVLSLRAGWGDPMKMGNAAHLASRRSAYRQDAIAAGLDPAFVDSELPPWNPLSPAQLFDALGADRGWLPR